MFIYIIYGTLSIILIACVIVGIIRGYVNIVWAGGWVLLTIATYYAYYRIIDKIDSVTLTVLLCINLILLYFSVIWATIYYTVESPRRRNWLIGSITILMIIVVLNIYICALICRIDYISGNIMVLYTTWIFAFTISLVINLDDK